LKHGGLSQKGMGELPALASSGRTSIPNDREIQKSLYRAAGYRVAGTRAVRVDILERLADLIRPAIAWKSGATAEKPQGAIDGFGFTVSVGMTSLVGCAGEDFASILKALGYRMDRRPAPIEPKPEEATPKAAPQSAPEASTEATIETPPAVEAAEGTVSPEMAVALSEVEVPAAPEPTAEPAMIEVWRPGRPRADRKPDRKRSPRKEETKADGAASQEAAPANTNERPRHERRDKRGKDRNKERGKDRNNRDSANFKPRPERREKPIDPNSPFASLMALKERLEADKKDKG
jgi:ATP-dependent RNA helicase SUPV3L1/SUV3